MEAPIKSVTVPARDDHEGIHWTTIKLRWVCPVCGGRRGEIRNGLSWDGSRRLAVNVWHNPCGHVDKYPRLREEAAALKAELALIPTA